MYNFASDATFNDTMTRVAGTDASFADVWPIMRSAVLSGRPLTPVEHARLEGFVAQSAHARAVENDAISQPRVHTGQAEISRPVGVGEVSKVDQESGPKTATDEPIKADATPADTPKPK